MSQFVQMSPLRCNQLPVIKEILQGMAKRSNLRPGKPWTFMAPRFAEDTNKEIRCKSSLAVSNTRNMPRTMVDIIGKRVGVFCGHLYTMGFLHLGLSFRRLNINGSKTVEVSGLRFIRPVDTKLNQYPFEAMFVVPLCDNVNLASSIADGFKRVTKREANLDVVEECITQSGLSEKRKRQARTNLALWRLKGKKEYQCAA